MKKQTILALAILVSTFSFAQKNELKAAEKAIKEGNYADAKKAISAAEPLIDSADDKTKVQFYYLKGQALYANGKASSTDADAAVENFDKAEQLEGGKGKYTSLISETRQSMFNDALAKANSALENKNYAVSSSGFERVYKLSPRDTTFLYYAAVTAVQSEDYDKALRHYEELKNLNYSGIETEYVATSKATGQEEVFGNKPLRDASVRAGSHTTPKDKKTPSKKAEIAKNIGLIYINKGQNEKAIAAMKDARKVNPDDVSLIISEANVQLQMGNKEEFKSLVQEALSKDPNNAELLFNLGILAAEAGEKESAKTYYDKAVEIKPDYVDVYINMAVLALSNEQGIIEQMNALGTSAADNKKYDQLKADILNVYKEAIPYLEKALKLQPNNLNAAKTLMNIYNASDDTDKYQALKAKVQALEAGN